MVTVHALLQTTAHANMVIREAVVILCTSTMNLAALVQMINASVQTSALALHSSGLAQAAAFQSAIQQPTVLSALHTVFAHQLTLAHAYMVTLVQHAISQLATVHALLYPQYVAVTVCAQQQTLVSANLDLLATIVVL